MISLRRFMDCHQGSTAAEFALVLPLMLLLSIGTIAVGAMMFANTALHYATQDSARCYAVKTSVCANADAVQDYGEGKYGGPPLDSLTFTATAAACGRQVVGTGTFVMSTGLGDLDVDMSATACYPA